MIGNNRNRADTKCAMGRRDLAKGSKTRFAIVVTAVLVGVLLTAEGLSLNGRTSATTQDRRLHLCQVIPRVNRLHVSRSAPVTEFAFTFPPVVTVTRASAARAVARAACALPDAPTGAQACPAEFAVTYQLVFGIRGDKGMSGDAIVMNPTGCRVVSGIGRVREAISSNNFYQVLGRAMGLTNASDLTFRGSFRS